MHTMDIIISDNPRALDITCKLRSRSNDRDAKLFYSNQGFQDRRKRIPRVIATKRNDVRSNKREAEIDFITDLLHGGYNQIPQAVTSIGAF